MPSSTDLRALTANDAQLADVATFAHVEGTGVGSRVLAVAPDGGLHTRILLDHGLDLGRAWYAGRAISWTSAAGPRVTSHGATDDDGWHRGWEGGLVTTCGLRNVGEPLAGQPRHGRYTENAAQGVAVETDLEAGTVQVRGVVRENDGVGRLLVVRREWTFHLGQGHVELQDVTTNESGAPVIVPMLYHVNLGYPFLEPGSRVVGSADVECGPMGEPRRRDDEVRTWSAEPVDGWSAVSVTSPARGQRVTVRWRTAELPLCHSWRNWRPGAYVQGIEPANCVVGGVDEPGRGAPALVPGESRTTRLSILVEES
ncbi:MULTISPECIES: DUF4432 family protein [unclassified Isoptericola]|uniref:DUF4432 family protein n=1 Tax=unclassified Isoptericola TaxID=2623355 RepID=UPI003666014D